MSSTAFASRLLQGRPERTKTIVEEVAERTNETNQAEKAAFRQMVAAAFDDESLDMKATLKQIAEILKTQEKLMGKPADGPAEETESVSWLKRVTEGKLNARSFASRLLF